MRVSFVLTHYALSSGKVISAVREVFGNRLAKYANCVRDVEVECSAERFTRFLIARNEFGATNSFRDLKLKIIEPTPKAKKEVFD